MEITRVCESFWVGLIGLLPQLLVTFSGVFLAFMFDRGVDWYRNRQKKRSLRHDLHNELKVIRDKLTGKGNLHFPDIWDSAISSGQIRLLESEQVRKLTSVYRDVKGIEYEAKRVRDLAEEVRIATAKGVLTSDMAFLWNRYTSIQKDRETKLREKINELLEEKWWGTKKEKKEEMKGTQ
jgi:hypothetical protein